MLKLAKLATPSTAVAVVGAERVPPPGFTTIDMATVPANPVAVLPSASRAVTWTAGVTAAPAVVLVGCTVNTSVLAAPGVTLHGLLTAPASPGARDDSVE